MMRVSLENLPPEVLHEICRYLSYGLYPSLGDFALTSKRCYAASTPFLFREINVYVPYTVYYDFNVVTNAWIIILERASSFRHVRRLEIKKKPTTLRTRWRSRAGKDLGLEVPHNDDDDLSRAHLRPLTSIVGDNNAAFGKTASPIVELNWQLLASLMQKLCGLRDLVYSYDCQFPPCLLKTLHESLPNCRLHLQNFELRSEITPSKPTSKIGAYELKLASSPCLCSITIIIEEAMLPGGERCAFIQPEMIKVLRGLAPNLKRACFTGYSFYHTGGSPKPLLAESMKKPESGPDPDAIKLHSLTVVGHLGATIIPLISLQELVVLKLQGLTWPKLSPSLMARNLASLQTLVLDVINEDATVGDSLTVSEFLRALRPLKNLRIPEALMYNVLDAVMGRHGSTLRKFWIDTASRQSKGVCVDQIMEICKHCQHLTEISLPIRRLHGGTQEVAMYRALGALPQLRHAALALVCRPKANLRDLEGMGGGTKSHLHSMMINSAIDSSLARAIFQEISSAQSATQQLESLSLFPRPDPLVFRVNRSSHLLAINILLRRWFRVCAEDSGTDPIVRALPTYDSNEQRKSNAEFEIALREIDSGTAISSPPYSHAPEVAKVFRDLWPRRGESFEDDWYSFPLAKD